ncbi:hypothetical protein [Oceanobacillus jordanicus]|uniref:Uncharacterized protein n=1 Tax=Oceanobacillus jordanicus TaxID=2867266 RepID=A0AAW5B7M3_9BACI|nr:hypothetical protein [Oceanobacillus jordanicus]MCG3420005.1 hypothetical protein [Oceanobacillus jordanicus]
MSEKILHSIRNLREKMDGGFADLKQDLSDLSNKVDLLIKETEQHSNPLHEKVEKECDQNN